MAMSRESQRMTETVRGRDMTGIDVKEARESWRMTVRVRDQ